MEKYANAARVFALLFAAVFLSTTSSAQWPDGGPDMTIDPKAKAEAVASLVKDLRENYVFPGVGDKVAGMIEDGEARGAFNSITSSKQLSELLNKQMFDVAHDQHLHILYSSQTIPPVPPPGATPQEPDPQLLLQLKKDNYSFQQAKRLDGNIGYLKMSAFSDADLGGPTVAGAMAFLANTDALIIDLRENSGGYAAMVTLLASYFFSGEPAVHLNDLEWRRAGTREYTLTQWWVFPSVPGPRYVGKEVYVLTGHDTRSAAEEFAYDLQTQKRATIVGETTWGGANPGEVLRLGDHFQVFMPTGHAVNPITKTNWEGLGVKPDIEVSKENALRVAQKAALDHLVAKTTNEQELAVLKRARASLEGAAEEPQKQ